MKKISILLMLMVFFTACNQIASDVEDQKQKIAMKKTPQATEVTEENIQNNTEAESTDQKSQEDTKPPVMNLGETDDPYEALLNGKYGQTLTISDGDTNGNAYELMLHSNDAVVNTSVSCSQWYHSGNFKLVLTYDRKIINEVDLGFIEVPSKGLHSKNIVGPSNAYMIEKYGSCNGNSLAFYEVDDATLKIRPLKLEGLSNNEIFVTSFDKTSFNEDENYLQYSVYNNAAGKWSEIRYGWNGKTYQFEKIPLQ